MTQTSFTHSCLPRTECDRLANESLRANQLPPAELEAQFMTGAASFQSWAKSLGVDIANVSEAPEARSRRLARKCVNKWRSYTRGE